MKRAVVQLGHVPGEGAQYETEHIRYIAPYVIGHLTNNGVEVGQYGAELPYGIDTDVAIFLHCDSGGTGSSGFSIGFYEELHPGSKGYADYIYKAYRSASGLPFIGYNITVGEWHYYGNRHFTQRSKCALIEMGFVSNPAERAYLKANKKKLGTAIADGMLAYLGIESGVTELALARSDSGPVPVESWSTAGYQLSASGAHFYLDIVNKAKVDIDVIVQIQRLDNGDYGSKTVKVKKSLPGQPGMKSFELGQLYAAPDIGNFSLDMTSSGPMVVIATQEK